MYGDAVLQAEVMTPLRILQPCEEDWGAMPATQRGRFCARCQREVLDLTARSMQDIERIVKGAECVRLRSADSMCPGAKFRFATLALVAAASCLTGCVDAESVGRERAHYASLAGCPGPPDPGAGMRAPPEDLTSTDICTIFPDAPQCQAAYPWHALGDSVIERGPMHLRSSCEDLPDYRRSAVMMGNIAIPSPSERRRAELTRPSAYPDGMDVVVSVAADGVDIVSARRVAHGMLDPLERCYRRHVDDRARTAPQGRVFVTARIASDGSVADVAVEASPALPGDLVVCAASFVRASHLEAPTEDLASVEIDVRFIYRTLPPARSDAEEGG